MRGGKAGARAGNGARARARAESVAGAVANPVVVFRPPKPPTPPVAGLAVPGFRILGKGSFGCVVTPSPTCDSDADARGEILPDKVAKFQKSLRHFTNEKAAQDILRDVDPDGEFTVWSDRSCEASRASGLTRKVREQCLASYDDDEDEEENLYVMIFNDAGVEMEGFLSLPSSPGSLTFPQIRHRLPMYSILFLNMYANLFSGLSKLHAKGLRQSIDTQVRYSHTDLNLKNVMVKTKEIPGTTDLSSHVRMIDFGMAPVHLARLRSGAAYGHDLHRYGFQPPDYSVVHSVAEGFVGSDLPAKCFEGTRKLIAKIHWDSVPDPDRIAAVTASIPAVHRNVKLLYAYLMGESERRDDFEVAVNLLRRSGTISFGAPMQERIDFVLRTFPWRKIDVYQLGINAAYVFLHLYFHVKDTDDIQNIVIIDDVCGILLSCVSWCFYNRREARDVAEALNLKHLSV